MEMEGIIRVILQIKEIQKENFENAFTQGLKVKLAKKIDKEQLGRWEENQNIVLGAKEEESIKKAEKVGIFNNDICCGKIKKDKDQWFAIWEFSINFLRASFQYLDGTGSQNAGTKQ